jgi:two-component system cell cycle response regulator
LKEFFLPGFLILYCISAGLGLFLGPDPSSLLMVCWIAGYAVLALAYSYTSFISKARLKFFPFIVLGIIELNFIEQVTGGARSVLWPAYFLFAAVVAAFSPLRQTYAMTALILGIEGANLLLSGQWDAGKWPVYAAFALPLSGMSAVISHIMQRTRREADRVKDVHERLLAHADGLDPLAGSGVLESLTAENRLASNINAALERDDAFAGLIDMIYEFVPAHTYALFLKEHRNGAEVFTLRAERSNADGSFLAPVGTELDSEYDHGIVSECSRDGQPRHLSSMERAPGNLGYYVKPIAIKSVFAIPIVQGDEARGVLVVDSLEPGAFSLETQDTVTRFAPFFIQIIEKIRLSQESDIRARNFAGLHKLSSVLSSSLDLDNILERLAAELKVLVPYDFCLFARYDERSREVIIAHQSGMTLRGKAPSLFDNLVASLKETVGEQAETVSEQRFSIEESALLGQMLRRRESGDSSAYHFPDLGERGREIGLLDATLRLDERLRSLSCWPLVAGEKFIGAFFLGAAPANAFSEYHRYFVDTLMNQVAVVMDNAVLHQQVQNMAHTDGLTGLLNHRTFMDKLDEEFKRLDREEAKHFSLLLLDIDFFKKVNDEYGHPVGDVALRTIAGIIGKMARGIDFVARYGGEEFAVGMVGAETGGAQKMAERIRKAVEQADITAEKVVLKRTLSIGVASYVRGYAKKEILIDQADQALYQAKHAGRNRVCVYSGSSAVKTEKTPSPAKGQ